jgi:hypothetical protein
MVRWPAVPATRTADVHRVDDVVIARIRPGVVQSLEDAEVNLAACKAACEESPRPLLVDIRQSQPLVPEVRHHYSGERLAHAFTKLAMLVATSPLGRMMGSIYLRVVQIGVPARMFTDEEEALAWLRSKP